MTKFGKIALTNTTRDSAARRSRKSHITQVKKATAVGWKFDSQYDIIENRIAIRTGLVSLIAMHLQGYIHRKGSPMRKFEIMNGVAP